MVVMNEVEEVIGRLFGRLNIISGRVSGRFMPDRLVKAGILSNFVFVQVGG